MLGKGWTFNAKVAKRLNLRRVNKPKKLHLEINDNNFDWKSWETIKFCV
jgi:hypothetical protein